VVTVRTDETRKPLGKVEVKKGSKVVGSGRLQAGDKGVLTVTVDKLARGQHDLKAHFEGSTYLRESTSRKFTLKVSAPRRHRPLPNALAYVG
jgi:hypothetical protein